MELTAVVEALKLVVSKRSPLDLADFDKVVIWTDSMYVFNHFNTAAHRWAQNNWNKASGAPVQNAKLWREIVRLRRRIGKPVLARWIKGKKTEKTKAVDKLAKSAARRPSGKPQTVKTVRRKWTSESVEDGCVPVDGQEIEIRIIGIEHLPLHRGSWRYKYEVVSGPYAGKVDRIVGEVLLQTRNVYVVRLNNHRNNPRIVEVISEMPALEHEAKPT